mmetsp:Transcript_148955/g.260285  ORF Transcript_148955/g.260285 Transcript_148955/m.260285 type:complete len:212 (+) Transcript_148955:3821-4456(+)
MRVVHRHQNHPLLGGLIHPAAIRGLAFIRDLDPAQNLALGNINPEELVVPQQHGHNGALWVKFEGHYLRLVELLAKDDLWQVHVLHVHQPDTAGGVPNGEGRVGPGPLPAADNGRPLAYGSLGLQRVVGVVPDPQRAIHPSSGQALLQHQVAAAGHGTAVKVRHDRGLRLELLKVLILNVGLVVPRQADVEQHTVLTAYNQRHPILHEPEV